MRLAGPEDALPDGEAVARGHVDLEAELAGEADPKQPHRYAGNPAFGNPHVRERLGVDVDVLDERCQDVARARTLHRDHGPLLGDRGEPDIELRPLGLEIVFHQSEDASRTAGGGGDVVAIGCQTADDAIVEHEAVLAAEHGVTAAAGCEPGQSIYVDAVEEDRGVRPDNLDLAERGGVEHTGGRTHRGTFPQHRRVHGLEPGGGEAREVARTFPLPDILEHPARALGPGMDRRAALGIEQCAAGRPCESAERHGRVGHAERGVTDAAHRHVERVCDDRQRLHVRRLALVGCHARRGVALHMLDRAEPLARRQQDVLGGDVVLVVHEGACTRGGPVRRAPGERGRVDEVGAIDPPGRLVRGKTAASRGITPSGRTIGECGGEAVLAAAGAGGALALDREGGQVGTLLRIEAELAAGLREEVNRRRHAARHQQQVARESASTTDPAVLVDRADLGSVHGKTPMRALHGVAEENGDAGFAHQIDERRTVRAARIDDRTDGDTAATEIERDAIGRLVCREQNRAPSRRDAVAVEVGARRIREHHTRPVVAREHQRPLERAGREHHLGRAHLPQALARRVRPRSREVIGQTLRETEEIMRTVGEGGRADEPRDVRHRVELGERARDPGSTCDPVDRRVPVGEQRAAHLRLLVAQDDARVAAAGDQGSRETRGSCPHDQHLAMREAVQVAIGIGLARRASESRGAADQRFVAAAPGAARPHEGLVVKARRQQRGYKIVDRADVEGKRGKAVLAGRCEPVIELDLGRTQVRRLPRRVAGDGDQRIRLVDARRHDAARTVILERPADQADTVRQQRRCERVARVAGECAPVEGEVKRATTVDAGGDGRTKGTAHAARSASADSVSGRTSPT